MSFELKNAPPGQPVAAATRPPPDSTDAQKDTAIEAIRLERSLRPGGKGYDKNAAEQTVSLMVNNGDFGGYRAIGRFFPNGANTVSVTADELEELKAEPQALIRVVSAEELGALGKNGPSANSGPALTDDEQKVLASFRSSGLDSTAYLAQLQKTETQPSGSSATPSTSSSASSDGSSKRSK